MKTTHLLAGLMLAMPLLSLAKDPLPAAPEAVFRLEPYRKTIALRGSVRGHEGLFLFDTAGGISLLSPDFAKKIGCDSWGRISGHRMMGDRLDAPRCDNVPVDLGDATFDLPVVALVDITKFLPEGATPVDGSLALDMFDGRVVTLDFPGRRLIVETPASLAERTKTAKEVPAKLAREIQGRALAVNVGVPTRKGMLWMELDSGNGGTVLVAAPYAELVGLKRDVEQPQQADFAVTDEFRATGMAFAPDKMILDGNLGMPFLRDKVVTFDLARGRVWLSRGPMEKTDR
jgi:hypothetical protein